MWPARRFTAATTVTIIAASVAVIVVVTIMPMTPARAQGMRPDQPWRVLESTHFRVTFAPGLDSLAARTAVYAESVRVALTHELGPAPSGRVDLVLSDDTDDSNGFSGPFPSNRVTLYAHPPVEDAYLGDFDEWMPVLLAHELTHTWQLDRAGLAGKALRRIFGRVPFGWPFFPVVGAPGWFLEGSAVTFETGLTGHGRLAGHMQEMMLRTAILEGRHESYDRLSNPTTSWPTGYRPYAFGSLFMDHLARAEGSGIRARLTDKCATAVVPPPLAFDLVAKRACGRSFSAIHREWRDELARRYSLVRDSIRARGETSTEIVNEGGTWSGPARFSPDGRYLVYRRADGRRAPATVRRDLATGRERELFRHDVAANYAWLPDGDLLTAQPEIRDTYRVVSDLWRVTPDGVARQVTRGARLEDPDACPRTGAVVAVQNGGGLTRLVLVDPTDGRIRREFPSTARAAWTHPRWSPDGTRIAAERLLGGDRDIVVLSADGALERALTADPASDASPCWSPDGRFVIFASDRGGTWNLFAAGAAPASGENDRPRAAELSQVTNVTGGAFQPDVSPDGRAIVFSSYHADGMRIERIPFDQARWLDPPAALGAGDSTGSRRPNRVPWAGTVNAAGFSSHPYHAWRSLRPYYWYPAVLAGSDTGDYFGAGSSGIDLVGRHRWSAWGVADPRSGRQQGAAGYSWAGLGNPVLGIAAAQTWDRIGAHHTDGALSWARERERTLSVAATLTRARLHSHASMSAWGEVLERHRDPEVTRTDSLGQRLALRFPAGRLEGVGGSASYANALSRLYSISPEDGVTAYASVRERRGRGHAAPRDRGDTETRLSIAAYRAVGRVGWSRAVVASRFAALVRNGPGATWANLGAASGGTIDLGGTTIGGGRLLPLRGYPAGVRSGTRGFSATLEARIPLFLVERGLDFPPVFLEKTWLVAFADVGDAWSLASQGGTARQGTGWPYLDGRRLSPLASAGAELVARGALAHWLQVAVRLGIAQPVTGDGATRVYVALGGGGIAGGAVRPPVVAGPTAAGDTEW